MSSSVVNRSGLDQTIVQLALASISILIQYALLMLISSNAHQSLQLIHVTVVGCLAATVIGMLFIRGVSKYPGVEAGAYILPAFITSYMILIAMFIFSRLEYSRILLTSSFIGNIALFLCISSIVARRTCLMIGVVPEGGYENILAVEGVTWCVLLSPQDDVSALHAITVDLRANISEEWERKLAQFALNNLPVYHSKHLLESLTGKVELEHLSENNFGSLSPLRAYMSVKHVFDALAALVGLVLLVPVFLAIAIVIRLDSPGPVLFRQMRIGYQGRPFKVFKFRTMTHKPNLDAEDMLDAAKTKTDDQRVTKSGVFLRQSRLDELPQLLNVLKGEMTLIGPRPEADVLSLWYEKKIPFYPYRHIVRPGITGWAQVNQGHVAEVEEVKSKLHFDFYYIKHFSPWIDLLIIVRTIKTVLTGFGAK